MFHGYPQLRRYARRDPAGSGGTLGDGWAELALAFAAATHAAESESGDRGCALAAGGKPGERGLGPALAVRAVEGERVLVLEQVGDGGETDRGGHASACGCAGSADEPAIDGVGLQAY